jgi:hypothetical protein
MIFGKFLYRKWIYSISYKEQTFTSHKYYCSECVKHKINEPCDEECLQRKEGLRKRLLLLDKVIAEQ